MKTFYLLISNPLPSDSEVLFFKTLQEAEAKRTELRALLNEDELGIELGETSYANYYVAEFAEVFEDSRVAFYHTLSNANIQWNEIANAWVKSLNIINSSQVSRVDRETWRDEDDNLLYDESINTDGSWDIFCAFDQNYSTLRIGRVSYEG
jgi:hypothetical protein